MEFKFMGKRPRHWARILLELTMKTFLLLCCTVTFAFGPSKGFGQNAYITIKEDRTLNVKQVFRLINRQTDYKFIYRHDLIKSAPKLLLKKGVIKTGILLDKYLSPIDFTSEFTEEGTIIVKKIPDVGSNDTTAQSAPEVQFQVSGTVTDEEGEPLPGVNVVVKETTNGVSTGFEGNYDISVTDDSAILVFSYIGFATQEIPINGQSTINVTLLEDASKLDEVVVTALGIKREKKSLGYAVSSIKSDQLTETGNPANPLQALYGNASGVLVQSTSSGPTGGMVIKIRNAVALTEDSSTRPLFVVDGIPIYDENTSIGFNTRSNRDRGTGINDINSEDIESIEILKGAKAAVLYGSLGANGVVLISTKSGKKKKGLGVEISSNFSVDRAAFYPEYQNVYGTGENVAFARLDQDQVSDDGFRLRDGQEAYWDQANFNFGPKMDGRSLLWWDDQIRPYTSQPGNFSDIFSTGSQSSNTIAFSNGGDLGSFRAAYTFKDYKGIFRNSDQQNHNISFNGNLNVSDRIAIRYTGNYYYTDNSNAPYNIRDFFTYGIRRDSKPELLLNSDFLVDENGYYTLATQEEYGRRIGALGAIPGYFWGQTQNANTQERHHILQSLNLDYKATDWLNWTTTVGLDLTLQDDEVKLKVTRPLSDNPNQGFYSFNQRKITNFYGQSLLNYDFQLSDAIRMNGFVGGALTRNALSKTGAEILNTFFVENWFSFRNTTNPEGPRFSSERGSDVIYSLLGSAQFSFREQFYLDISARNDWSSILPPENNKFFYPGVSASWVISESLDLPEAFNYLKLRGSWADVGRPGPRYFGNLAFDVGTYGNVPYLDVPNFLPPADFSQDGSGFPQPNLKPERKREFEVGIETNLFQDNRLGLEFSYYKSNTYDQIMAVSVPRASGVEQIRVNAGDVQNTGWDAVLRGTPIKTQDFSWNTSLSLSGNKTKIVELAKGVEQHNLWGGTGVQITAEVGGEYGEVSVRPYERDENGNLLITDGGEFKIDSQDWKKVGKVLPDIIGGFNTSFQYKNFDLNAGFDFQFGAILPSHTNMYLLGNGSGIESLKYRDEESGGLPYYVNQDRNIVELSSHDAAVPDDSFYNFIFHDGVKIDGVNENSGQPNDVVISASQYYQQFWNGDQKVFEDRIFKKDYIALRRVSLGWNASKKAADRFGFNTLRVFVYGNNLAYIYKAIPNISPEALDGTNAFVENNGLPLSRSIGMGINVSF